MVAVCGKIARHIRIGIPVAVRTFYPDFPAAELVAQALQHADLIGQTVNPDVARASRSCTTSRQNGGTTPSMGTCSWAG